MLRVLIADSDEYLLTWYGDYLMEHGFSVASATSGLDCVKRLRAFEPDVLVLEPDIAWGGGDGVLALMHEHGDVPLVPVMVLTHGCPSAMLYSMAPYGVDDYQKKPMTPERMADRIRLIVGRRAEDRASNEQN